MTYNYSESPYENDLDRLVWNTLYRRKLTIPSNNGMPYIKLDIEKKQLFILGESSSPLVTKLYLRIFQRTMCLLCDESRFTLIIGLDEASAQSKKMIQSFIASVKKNFPDLVFKIYTKHVNSFGLQLIEGYGAESMPVDDTNA